MIFCCHCIPVDKMFIHGSDSNFCLLLLRNILNFRKFEGVLKSLFDMFKKYLQRTNGFRWIKLTKINPLTVVDFSSVILNSNDWFVLRNVFDRKIIYLPSNLRDGCSKKSHQRSMRDLMCLAREKTLWNKITTTFEKDHFKLSCCFQRVSKSRY